MRVKHNKCNSIKNKYNLSTKIIPEKVKNIFKSNRLIKNFGGHKLEIKQIP